MSLHVLIDMNLSPDWVSLLTRSGFSALHWSSVGDPRASDREIMDWAVSNKYSVLTHDLDFGNLLALTHQTGPSVIQLRVQDVLPQSSGATVVATLRQYEPDLKSGALVVVDGFRNWARVLPL